MTSTENKLRALLAATYPHNILLSVFVFLGLSMGGNITLENASLAFLVWWFLVSSITVLNVITDWEIDRKNRKNRFIHENTNERELFSFFIILAGLAVVFSLAGTDLMQLAVIISVLIGVLYSVEKLRLKEILIINYIVMGATWGVLGTIIGLSAVSASINPLQWTVIAIMGVYIFIASQIKDFEDVEGDKNGSTLPKLNHFYTPKTYIALNYLFFISLLLLILVGLLPFKFIVTMVVLPAYAILFDSFLKARSREEYRKIHIEVMLLIDIFVILFGFIFLI